MNEEIKKAAQKLKEQVEHLNNTKKGHCYVCDEEIGEWIIIIPNELEDDIGFGKADGTKTRVAFVPVCYKHDIRDSKIQKKIKNTMQIKIMTMKN